MFLCKFIATNVTHKTVNLQRIRRWFSSKSLQKHHSINRLEEAYKRVKAKCQCEGFRLFISLLHKGWIWSLAKKLPKDVNPQAVFACNELDLKEVNVYGFDYDYTLACYKPSMDYLLYNLGRSTLIEQHKVLANNRGVNWYFSIGFVCSTRKRCPNSNTGQVSLFVVCTTTLKKVCCWSWIRFFRSSLVQFIGVLRLSQPKKY